MMKFEGMRWKELNEEAKTELLKDYYIDKDYIDNNGIGLMDFGCGLTIKCKMNEFEEFEPIEDESYDDYFIGENPHSWVE